MSKKHKFVTKKHLIAYIDAMEQEGFSFGKKANKKMKKNAKKLVKRLNTNLENEFYITLENYWLYEMDGLK